MRNIKWGFHCTIKHPLTNITGREINTAINSIATGYGVDEEEFGFHSWQGQEIFLFFSEVSRLTLGPTSLLSNG
jgi:hypothetical protein